MKKNSKILILGLGLSLAFAPINSLVSSNINVAYAAEENTGEEELTLEEYIDQAKKFMESDDFKKFKDEDKESYKNLLENLSVENLEKEKSDEIIKEIEKTKLPYEYKELKEEVLKLNVASLSDDLKKEVEAYKDSDEPYEDYETQIKKLKTIKSNIENYNKELAESKKILKDWLENSEKYDINFEDEKAVLNDEKSNLDKVKKATDSLINKVKKEEKRQANLKTLKEIIDQEGNIKDKIYYKKASQSLKDKFNQSLESIKSAYNNLNNNKEVKNVEVLVNAYDSAYNNLDGIQNEKEFNDKYEELKQYFEKNKNKLSKENQEKFANLINELPNKEDSNLESIKKLKAEIDKAIEENQKKGELKKVSRQVAVKKQPATKKSRSFVRTGVKSVGIVLVVLILAGIAYFFVSKKSKNNK